MDIPETRAIFDAGDRTKANKTQQHEQMSNTDSNH